MIYRPLWIILYLYEFLLFSRQDEEMKVRQYQQDLRQRGLEKVNIMFLVVSHYERKWLHEYLRLCYSQ